jgi:hypothetical protein
MPLLPRCIAAAGACRALTHVACTLRNNAGAARRNGALHCRAAAAPAGSVDRTINPRVASLNESKTMALTDLARAMKEAGKPVRARAPRGRRAPVRGLLLCNAATLPVFLTAGSCVRVLCLRGPPS